MDPVVKRASGVFLSLICIAGPSLAAAQTPTMPSTQRYGSGLLDIPVSSVLPHRSATATFSGFFLDIGRRVEIDGEGRETGVGPGVSEFFSDASVAFGLFDRAELGASFQAFGDESSGGDIWGLFGRVRLLEPIDQGLGLAVGARYLTSPDYGDGLAYEPGRLGFSDERLRESYGGSGRSLGTNLSLYGVATAYLRGFDKGPLPVNDMTFSLGFGSGMFRDGGDLAFYEDGGSTGWFFGSSVHFAVGTRSLLALMAEYNGFDTNVGAQVDYGGLKAGVQYLALNHDRPVGGHGSEYQKPKFGVLASVAVCPDLPGLRCKPRSMERTEPDTIWIPAPPPDTVIVSTAMAAPAGGTETTVCLSTGQNFPITVTPAADTLVGPTRVPIESLRPGVVFGGTYAGETFWFRSSQRVLFEETEFGRSEDAFPIDCEQILRVGVYEGVPVYADRAAERPLVVIFIPVRPGLWQRYERGLPDPPR